MYRGRIFFLLVLFRNMLILFSMKIKQKQQCNFVLILERYVKGGCVKP